MLSTDELRKLMLPWVGVLRDYVDLGPWNPDIVVRDTAITWLTMDATSRLIDERAFDGLELLTLLGQIDIVAWRMALGSAWPRHASAWIEAANGKPLHLGVSVHVRWSETEVDPRELCARLVVNGIEHTRPREYLRARSVLEHEYCQLEQATTHKNLKPLPRKDVTLPVRLTVSQSPSPLEPALLRLLQVLSEQHTRTCQASDLLRVHAWQPLTHVTEVGIRGGLVEMSPKAFVYATALVGLDVALNELSLLDVRVTVDSAGLYVPCLQTLLATSNCMETNGSRHAARIGKVTVPLSLHRPTVTAVYSALAFSSSTSSVSIDRSRSASESPGARLSDNDRSFMWQWIALALFSSHMLNSIEEANLCVDELTESNVKAMASVLDDDDPIRGLYQDPATTAMPHSATTDQWRIASTFRLFPTDVEVPMGTESSVHVRPQIVRVVGLPTDGWIKVLLPAWGAAWVREDECTVFDSALQRPPATRTRSVSRLELHTITSANLSPVLSMMQLVGHGLTRLVLCARPVEFGDEWILTVVQACPHLEEFEVSIGVLRSLNTFAEPYERGFVRAHRLDIKLYGLVQATGLCDWWRKLATANHPMAQHVRVLTISLMDLQDPDAVTVPALQSMLEANTGLHTCEIHATMTTDIPADQLPVTRAFSLYEKPVAVRLLPLSIRNKLAFLSVVRDGPSNQSHSIDGRSSSMCQLDSRVSALVFQFAAQCRKRKVLVNMHKRLERAAP